MYPKIMRGYKTNIIQVLLYLIFQNLNCLRQNSVSLIIYTIHKYTEIIYLIIQIRGYKHRQHLPTEASRTNLKYIA